MYLIQIDGDRSMEIDREREKEREESDRIEGKKKRVKENER